MTSWQLLNYCVDVIGAQNCDIRSDYEVYPPDYWIQIPCGTCYHCLKNKRNYWVFRLLQELVSHKESTFVTLTLDDESLSKFKGDYKRPLKLYIDRLRKALGYRPRYWFISELGDEGKYTGRLHYHGFFFGTDKKTLNFALQRSKWSYGVSWFGYVKTNSIYYVTKYVVKQQPRDDYKPFIFCSNGIGACYVTQRNFERLLNNFDPLKYVEFYGKKFPISPYYKRKFFNEDLQLIFRINRYNTAKSSNIFRGIRYIDDLSYLKAMRRYYESTLRDGLSVFKPKRFIDYNHIDVDYTSHHFSTYKDLKLF